MGRFGIEVLDPSLPLIHHLKKERNYEAVIIKSPAQLAKGG